MKPWCVLALVICLVGTQSLEARAADITVFGLSLGSKYSLPNCPKGLESPGTICSLGASMGNTFRIRVPNAPDYVWRALLIAEIHDGTIEGFSFLTNGLPYQQRVLDALKEKYGKPAKFNILKLQNGYGAKFDVYTANWSFKEFTVEFIGAADGDSGIVEIITPKLAAARKAEKAKQSQSSPKL